MAPRTAAQPPAGGTPCPAFVVTDQHVARNPVARAIARQQLTTAVRDFATRLYLLADGEPVQADGLAAARVLAVAIRVCEMRGQQDSPACRVMRGGLEAVVQLSARRWAWRRADASALDTAIHHAQQVFAGATALEQKAAHRFVIALEQQVSAPRQPAAQHAP